MTEVSAKNTQGFPWYTYVRVSSVSFLFNEGNAFEKDAVGKTVMHMLLGE